MASLIDFSQSFNNISFITIIFLFIPGYISLLFSNHLLKKKNKLQYIYSKIDKWEIILWSGIYSILVYIFANLINQIYLWRGHQLPLLENYYLLFILYLIGTVMVGYGDYKWRATNQEGRSGHYNISEEIDDHYKKNESYVWIKMKSKEKFRGQFLGIDYGDNKWIKIGSTQVNGKTVPIKKIIDGKKVDLKSKTMVLNLNEVEHLLFEE